ncbi:hypothetical protein [Methanogenium cariaci]|uniref:hypothetical protein n=1 Tax=Methanogenium cariaci TaxID=2197 RepID=UPI000784D235|nr:hypothetical protein [Methanogenium cariaci]
MMSIDSSGSSDLRTMFNRGRQSVQSKNLELATKSGADIVLNEVRTTKNKGGAKRPTSPGGIIADPSTRKR